MAVLAIHNPIVGYSKWASTDFYAISPTVLGLDVPDYYHCIFERSTQGLRKFLHQRPDLRNPSQVELPSLLACAIDWPEGFVHLLAAGFAPFDALEIAIFSGRTETLKLLLSYDCPFFVESRSEFTEETSILDIWFSVTTHALHRKLPDCEVDYFLSNHLYILEALIIIVDHLASLRQELQAFAQLHYRKLSDECRKGLIKDAGIGTGTLLDASALRVYNELQEGEIDVPKHLWPGTCLSVYHVPGLTKVGAELLSKVGFKDLTKIDSADPQGRRPLSYACQESRIHLANWIVDRGAAIRLLDIQALVGSVRFPAALLKPREDVTRFFVRADDVGKDTCQCYCSSSGCVPASYLARGRNRMGWHERFLFIVEVASRLTENRRSEWLKESCRAELFSRLGCTHTCCQASDASTWTQGEDGEEIREEERGLGHILDNYVQLFEELSCRYHGDWKTFWKSWWMSLELFLPRPRSRYSGTPVNRDDEPTILSKADLVDETDYGPNEDAIRNTVSHFPGVHRSMERLADAYQLGEMPRSFTWYLGLAGIDHLAMRWLTGEENDGWKFSCASPFGEAQIYHACYSDYSHDKEKLLKGLIVPFVAVGVVQSLEIGFDIPHDILKHLELEGILKDGYWQTRCIQEETAEDILSS